MRIRGAGGSRQIPCYTKRPGQNSPTPQHSPPGAGRRPLVAGSGELARGRGRAARPRKKPAKSRRLPEHEVVAVVLVVRKVVLDGRRLEGALLEGGKRHGGRARARNGGHDGNVQAQRLREEATSTRKFSTIARGASLPRPFACVIAASAMQACNTSRTVQHQSWQHGHSPGGAGPSRRGGPPRRRRW